MKNNKSGKNALKFILIHSKSQSAFIALIIFLTAFSASFGTVTALITKYLLDSAQQGLAGNLYKFCILLVSIAFLQILLFALLRYLNEKCRAKLDIAFRKSLFSDILSKQYSKIKSYHSGELINMLTSDTGIITDAVISIPTSIASVIVRLVCAFGVLIFMQWQFAILFAFAGIFIFTTTQLLKDKIKTYHKQMQQKDGKVRSFWQEIVENLLVIKAYCAEDKSTDKAYGLLDEHYKVRMKKNLISTLSTFANHTVMRAGYLFALIYCSVLLAASKISFGSLTAITQLVGQVQHPFQSLTGIFPKYYAAISSAERIMDICNIECESCDKTENYDIENVSDSYGKLKYIQGSDIIFAYDKDVVLKSTSFCINKGDFISITGHSGIGKSTLFKLLLNIYPLNSGQINFVFNDGQSDCSSQTRKLFAFVPQGNLLFSGTLRENLLFLSEHRSDEEIMSALEKACALDFVKSLEQGLDTRLGEDGIGLSEGQLQRLAVARALLSDRPILLLDEATSALDEKTEAKLLSNIKSLPDKTVLIVTHKKAALEICNRHFLINDGCLVDPKDS